MSTKPKAPEKLPVQHRFFEVDRAGLNEEKRTLELSFSSDTPVRRWFGNEVLDHSKGAVRMQRMNGGAPMLANHDPDQHIGIVESASVSDGKGRAMVRFGNSPLAQQKFQDVKDGILRNVSVGYIVHRFQITEADDKTPDEYRAIDWEPVEVSLVAVPADPTVGVGRAQAPEFPVVIDRKETPAAQAANPVQETRNMAETTSNTSVVEINKARQEAVDAELKRVRNISALAEQYKAVVTRDQATKWIAEETPEAEVRMAIGNLLIDRHKPVSGSPAEAVELTAKEKKDYSIVRLLNSVVRGDNCFELEVSEQIGKNLKRTPSHGGVFVPKSLDVDKAAVAEQRSIITGQRATPLVTTSGAPGGFTVETTVEPLIDILRNKIVARRLGARMLTGLRDSLLFPRQIAATAGFWMAENSGADVTEQDLSFGSFTLSPKTVMAMQSYSRQLLAQSTLDIEALVRYDIAAQIAIAIDAAVINGSGTSNQPTGILSQASIDVVALGTNGAQPTFANLVQQETDVAAVNADFGALAYATTPGIRGRLKQTTVLSNTIALPVWTSDSRLDGGLAEGEVNGYPAMASNNIPSTLTKGTSSNCHAIIFGAWDSVLIGEWNALEVLPDPYTKGAQAMVRVFAWDLCDTNLRYVSAFSVIKDALQ